MFLIVGVTLVLNGYNAKQLKCPAPVIKYKYLPKTFDESQDDPDRVSDIFRTMFDRSAYLDT